jgi:hypothetical protein
MICAAVLGDWLVLGLLGPPPPPWFWREVVAGLGAGVFWVGWLPGLVGVGLVVVRGPLRLLLSLSRVSEEGLRKEWERAGLREEVYQREWDCWWVAGLAGVGDGRRV